MYNLLSHQIIRFILVGGLNTAFSYSVYAGLIYIGLNYIIANFCSLVLGILFSFRTQGALVFNNRDGRLIFRFAGLWALLFVLNIGLIYILMRVGLNAYAAGAVALVPITVTSYFVQKVMVFRVKTSSDVAESS